MILQVLLLLSSQGGAKSPQLGLAALAGRRFSQKENYKKVSQISEFVGRSFASQRDLRFGGGPNTYVWRDGKRFVILEEFETGVHPGNNFANVAVFDENQRPISFARMIVGYRAGIKGSAKVAIRDVPGFSFRMDIWWESGTESSMFFALDGDRVALLRIQDAKGAFTPNTYAYPNWTLGSPPPAYSKEVLVNILKGNDRGRKLEAMTWLAGVHGEGYGGQATVLEPVPDTVRYIELSQDSEVRDAVGRFIAGSDPWLAEAATAFRKNWKPVALTAGAGERLTDKLVIEDVAVGKGSEFVSANRVATMNDDVVVSYFGTSANGEKILATGKSLANLRLKDRMCIEGLTKGLLGMRVGGTRKLTIPASMAYGETGIGLVPPHTDLILTVKLHYMDSLPHPQVDHPIDVVRGNGPLARKGASATILETVRRMDGSAIYEKRTKRIRIADRYSDERSDLLNGMRVGGTRRAVMNPFTPGEVAEYGPKIFEVELVRIGR